MSSPRYGVFIQAEGNMALLRERLSQDPDPETLLLLQHILRYLESGHISNQSKTSIDASHAEVRINCGVTLDSPDLASNASLLECELVLRVRRPLKLGDLEREAPPRSIQASVHSESYATISSHPSPETWSTFGISPLPSTVTVRSASYSVYSPASTGQESQIGSRWRQGLSPNRNSGFASGARSTVPKEGYEMRREKGMVGRIGNGLRPVPAGLAEAARGSTSQEEAPHHINDIESTGSMSHALVHKQPGKEGQFLAIGPPRETESPLKSSGGVVDNPFDYSKTWAIYESILDELQSLSSATGVTLQQSQPQPMVEPDDNNIFCEICSMRKDGSHGTGGLCLLMDFPPKKYICVEPREIKPEFTVCLPLSKCKACSREKRMRSAFYTATHLRQAHFLPRKRDKVTRQLTEAYEKARRGGKTTGDWPPMAELKRWMQPAKERASTTEPNDAKGLDIGSQQEGGMHDDVNGLVDMDLLFSEAPVLNIETGQSMPPPGTAPDPDPEPQIGDPQGVPESSLDTDPDLMTTQVDREIRLDYRSLLDSYMM